MFNADVLTLQEFAMHEELPLATVQRAVLEFLRGREDVVVFGAQAVNAYVDEPRMTQDIDLLAQQAETVAEEIRAHLAEQFRIVYCALNGNRSFWRGRNSGSHSEHSIVRVRSVANGKGFHVFQVRKAGNRHLVDLRDVEAMPPARRIADVLVMAPDELVAAKVITYHQRRGRPKAGTDWRDLALLLLTFPELKALTSTVLSCLQSAGATDAILNLWQEIVTTEIIAEEDEDEFS